MLNMLEQIERATRGLRLNGAFDQMERLARAAELHTGAGMTAIERIARDTERTFKQLEAISRPAITRLAEEAARVEKQRRTLFEAATIHSTSIAAELQGRERQVQSLVESATRHAKVLETGILARHRELDAAMKSAFTVPRIELPDMGWVDRALRQATTISSQVESWIGRAGPELARSWKEAARWTENLGGTALVIERAWERVQVPTHDWKSLLGDASKSVLSMGLCNATNDDIASAAVASVLTAYPDKLKTASPEEVRRILRKTARNEGIRHCRSRKKRREETYQQHEGRALEAYLVVSAREQAELFVAWAASFCHSGKDLAYLLLLGETQERIAEYRGESRGKLRAAVLDAMWAELARRLDGLSKEEQLEFIRVIRAEAIRCKVHIKE